MQAPQQFARSAFFVLFTASGFSGLIYQSIWSHYLKLFLGHAAYAQSLVLATFMGGMAIGSWISSRRSPRWRNLLLAYAIAEGAIGLMAIVFHATFLSATGMAYDWILPALGSPAAATAFKWSLSALLILPQSVLLGMTFPLMAGGIIRLHPQNSGATISMLYFTNSLGAAAGVLASGFVLIEKVGLPGTILTAGLLNIALALFVWVLVKQGRAPDAPERTASLPRAPAVAGYRLLLAVSLLTGTASFIYEIGWIRMLSMVFGSSTHAFELMLSAFILGLALGGLWIRRRIDGIAAPERFLGAVQVAMGLCALATLVLYDQTYALMEWLMSAISRSESGYVVFNVSSQLIALSVMLPTAFCAGTTLPLITHCLLRDGNGEKAIGAVYAANTVGAIVGVIAAVHVGLPLLGLKGMMTAGAGLDIALGLVLLWRAAGGRWLPAAASALGTGALIATLALVQLDPYKMASGVFRHGRVLDRQAATIEYHRDGKTATVNLVRTGSTLGLHTNGKPDATLNTSNQGAPRPDELAQVLSAALPLAANPGARSAANIGFGSGATSHVLLTAPWLTAVDSIEIEPFIVDAARRFQPRNELAYTDPRSRIFYEDAKTFFSLHDKRYDIIVSEPSNPWVSGTASLFTEEFYGRVRRHLNADGVFVQWLQMYEINAALVGSVLKALQRHFPDYQVFSATDIDFLIVARRDGALQLDPRRLFAEPRLARELARVGIRAPQDLQLHHAASAAALRPWVERLAVPANSDFFPVLEFRAPKARFMGESVGIAFELTMAPVPALEMLSGPPAAEGATPGARGWLQKARRREAALATVAYLLGSESGVAATPGGTPGNDALVARVLLQDCARPGLAAAASGALFTIARQVVPVLAPSELQPLWSSVQRLTCFARMSPAEQAWIGLYAAVSARDPVAMARIADALIAAGAGATSDERAGYLLAAALTGRLALGRRAEARELWLRHPDAARQIGGLQAQFLASHALAK